MSEPRSARHERINHSVVVPCRGNPHERNAVVQIKASPAMDHHTVVVMVVAAFPGVRCANAGY